MTKQLAWAWWVPPKALKRGRPPLEGMRRKDFVLCVRFDEKTWDRLPHQEHGELSRWVRRVILAALNGAGT